MKKITIDPITSQQILNEYNAGLSSIFLGKKYKVSPLIIIRTVKEMGTKIRTNKENKTKYTFNHNFFKVIDTSEKAYFLGFILADGHVGEKEVIIHIHNKDKHIIEHFVQCIGGNNTIHEPTNKSCFNNIKRQVVCARINLRSDKMIEDLNNLGITRRKTHNIVVPEIREDLQRHFWRGVFDGDGYVSLISPKIKHYEYKTIETGLCGHINTVTAFVDFLNRNGVTTSKIFPDHSIFSVRANGCNNVMKLYNLLYADIDLKLCLTRKREKFEIHKAYKERA